MDRLGFRVADWDTPLRANANRSPGRFNGVGSQATQYISLHPLAAWAEYLRYQRLTEPWQIGHLRLRVWVIRLVVDDVLELGFSEAPSHGLEPADLVANHWDPCQAWADELRADPAAPDAIKVPSAALPGTSNVVVFGERVQIPFDWPPIDKGDLPTAIISDGARPPLALLDHVRHEGGEHAELEAWLRGEDFRFADLRAPS